VRERKAPTRVDVAVAERPWLTAPRALLGPVLRFLARRPHDGFALIAAMLAAGAILVNALYRQAGPHPAPLFAGKPGASAPATRSSGVTPPQRSSAVETGGSDQAGARARLQTVMAIQRELAARGFYDGPIDGLHGPRMEGAIREFEQAAGVKTAGEPGEPLLRAILRTPVKSPTAMPASTGGKPARLDPIAELIAPSKRVLAVQRALSDFGYGQLQPSGVLDPMTKAAIEKFERDRKLPISGQISDRLTRELAAVTGRPLE
jgi:peptidoglycan hydrolase-like protein with peptidoglycan-binding domain